MIVSPPGRRRRDGLPWRTRTAPSRVRGGDPTALGQPRVTMRCARLLLLDLEISMRWFRAFARKWILSAAVVRSAQRLESRQVRPTSAVISINAI